MTEQEPGTLYCYVHPNRQTVLRCNRCERPICTSCAVLTPTGYRCKECVRGQQKIFDTARWYDYPLAIVIAGGLALLASLVGSRFGFFTILVAPIAGTIIAEAVRGVTRRRRSKSLLWAATGATFVGAILITLITFFSLAGAGGLGMILTVLWPVVFAALATSAVYYRLSGIRL